MRSALEKAREAPSSTKARILAAAEAVFATKGFAGASTREIAAKANVNISSLHYHWESKETLYFAVFENIYDRILDLVRRAIPADVGQPAEPVGGRRRDRWPLRFLRRQPQRSEAARAAPARERGEPVDIERDILVPAWRVFAGWTQAFSGRKLKDVDSQLFMLTIHSVVLLFLLDSRQFTSLLGGSVYTPEVRRRVRTYIIKLVHKMLARD